MTQIISRLVATVLGIGYTPKASGTFGSLAALPIVWGLYHYHADAYAMLALALFIFLAGVWATHKIIVDQKDKDPSIVVIDEVVGQMISFALVWPHLGAPFAWALYLGGFVLFRVFDIYKMGPVKFFDRKVHNAWGVMLDDVFAGIIAAAVLYLGITAVLTLK